jgi:hypothetical protein
MEATATRRAGLERFTFPSGSKPYFVLDLANDLPASFSGGTLDIDPDQGRITIGGHWGSRYVFYIWLRLVFDRRNDVFKASAQGNHSATKPSHVMTSWMEVIRNSANMGFGLLIRKRT